MSRLPPDHLSIVISRQGLSLLGEIHRNAVFSQSEPPQEKTLPERLGQLLTDLKPKSITIFISPSLVDMVVLPGMEYWLKDADLQAYARARLAAAHGADQNSRFIFVDRENYAVPMLAASLPNTLVEQLRAECLSHKVRLQSLLPITTRLVQVLQEALTKPAPTAIWFEEADAAWLALHAEGKWLSVRNIPAPMLQRMNRADLLHRECLASGLPSLARVYSARVDRQPLSDLGRPCIDCSEQLLAAPSRRRGIGDSKRTGLFPGWAVLSAASLAAAFSIYAWIDQQSAYSEASRMQMEQQQILEHDQQARRAAHAAQQASHVEALSAYQRQQAPWDDLLNTINQAMGETIKLDLLDIDALDGSISIEGKASRFEDLQVLTDLLQANPHLSKIEVASLARESETTDAPIKFSMTAIWNPQQEKGKRES